MKDEAREDAGRENTLAERESASSSLWQQGCFEGMFVCQEGCLEGMS